MLRRILLKWLFGFDFPEWKQEIESSLEIVSSQTASLTVILSEIEPYSKEWPEAASKAILSLDERMTTISEIIRSHHKVISNLVESPEEASTSWKKNNKNLN
jgi:hypothetical protein